MTTPAADYFSDSDSGMLERPFITADLEVPSAVALEVINGEEVLTWQDADLRQRRYPTSTRAGIGLLRDFLALQSGESVLAYAQRWGVLRIERPERVSVWLALSGGAAAILQLAQHLDEGSAVTADEIQRVWGLTELFESRWIRDRHQQGEPNPPRWAFVNPQGLATHALNELLRTTRIRPSIEWPAGRSPAIAFEGGGLLGILALQLLLAVCQQSAWATCAGCGHLYSANQRPRRDRNNYCPECRRNGASRRKAAREYRKRRRGVST